MPLPMKNKGPLLVDKVKGTGWFDRLPTWFRDVVTHRIEKQKVDAKVTDLDATAFASELKQEVTDEKLRTNTFLGDGEPGSGNDMDQLPATHPSEVVITQTGQVAQVTEAVTANEQFLVEGPPLQDGTADKVGNVWVTKKVEAPTFDRKVFQRSVEDLTPPKFMTSKQQFVFKNTVDGTAAMPAALGTNEQLHKEEQVKVGVKEVTSQQRDTTSAKPQLKGQKINNDFNGVVVNTFEDVVVNTATVTPVFGTTELSVTPYDEKFGVRAQSQAAAAFPVLQQYNYDPEINSSVVSVVSIVPHGDIYTPAPGVMDYSERKIDSIHKMRVVNALPAVPPTEVTYETRSFTFPGLLMSMDFRLVALAATHRSAVQWTAGVRAAFTVPTRHMTNTYYFLDRPEPNPTISWAPGDVTFQGVSYSISLSNLLYNTWNNVGVTYAADTYYGNIVDRFSITATNPMAATYVGWINTWQCISSTVTRYKRLWVKRDTFVVIQ